MKIKCEIAAVNVVILDTPATRVHCYMCTRVQVHGISILACAHFMFVPCLYIHVG